MKIDEFWSPYLVRVALRGLLPRQPHVNAEILAKLAHLLLQLGRHHRLLPVDQIQRNLNHVRILLVQHNHRVPGLRRQLLDKRRKLGAARREDGPVRREPVHPTPDGDVRVPRVPQATQVVLTTGGGHVRTHFARVGAGGGIKEFRRTLTRPVKEEASARG